MATTAMPQPVNPAALRIGAQLARMVFAKRGNHSEAHISEMELAALLALAAALGERQAHQS